MSYGTHTHTTQFRVSFGYNQEDKFFSVFFFTDFFLLYKKGL